MNTSVDPTNTIVCRPVGSEKESEFNHLIQNPVIPLVSINSEGVEAFILDTERENIIGYVVRGQGALLTSVGAAIPLQEIWPHETPAQLYHDSNGLESIQVEGPLSTVPQPQDNNHSMQSAHEQSWTLNKGEQIYLYSPLSGIPVVTPLNEESSELLQQELQQGVTRGVFRMFNLEERNRFILNMRYHQADYFSRDLQKCYLPYMLLTRHGKNGDFYPIQIVHECST